MGPISSAVAEERRNKKKGDVAAGELAVNGMLWKNRQWIPEEKD